ncbi:MULTISPECIES: DUF1905 domain-containing protein [unclassified Diaminobutyricimonas]|uniref:DUF1905 domain-containing protein n=1 Tax=unclassified Diaminobutyricimonas TaxID=2643261 RepID=UPI0012F48E73|nr:MULTISPECIES: DUF1905 domain-containing protein [unclassified Diaminobutyricimonas]
MNAGTAPAPLDHTFTAPIGVDVKGEVWSCVEMPDSAAFFGTGKAVKVTATVDNQPVTTSFMPTGRGGHMLSISAKLRKLLKKDVGDEVTVHLMERLS